MKIPQHYEADCGCVWGIIIYCVILCTCQANPLSVLYQIPAKIASLYIIPNNRMTIAILVNILYQVNIFNYKHDKGTELSNSLLI